MGSQQLPFLFEWATTRQGLHQAAQVVGAVQVAVTDSEPDWVHLGLRVTPGGLATGELPNFGTMALDFMTQTIMFTPPNRDTVGFSLVQHTQISLAKTIANGLEGLGYPIKLNYDELTSENIFDIRPVPAVDYARILGAMDGILGAFRESLPGEKSPLVVWSHGFDLAFSWFATDETNEKSPHIRFGFSPYSAGLDRPYLYTYPYPIPDNPARLDLPMLTRWHTENWTGTITDYDQIVRQHEPSTVMRNILDGIFKTVSPSLM